MVRYFMTTREAADLVLTSASHAEESRALTERTNGDERASVYVLKMGQPVRIYERRAHDPLAGYEPGEDIEIAVTGRAPGERLHEILFAREEPRTEIGIDGVMAAKPVFADRDRVDSGSRFSTGHREGDRLLAERVFEEAIPEFKRRKPVPQPAAPAPQARLASN